MSPVAHTATLPPVAYSIEPLSAAAVSFYAFSNALSYIAVLVCVKPAKRFNMCVRSQAQSQELDFRRTSISAHSTGSYCQTTMNACPLAVAAPKQLIICLRASFAYSHMCVKLGLSHFMADWALQCIFGRHLMALC